MAFLVRKINKWDKLFQICDEKNIDDIYADIPTTEFRTNSGTLSTWIINSLDELDEAVLAIAISSSQITKMDFIIIDTSILDENNLDYKKTYAGVDIAVPDLQDMHYDIENITLSKLHNCAVVYKRIIEEDNGEEKYIVRYVEGEIKDLIKKAIEENRVERSKATKGIRKTIDILTA